MDETRRRALEEKMQAYLGDSAHDAQHVYRVLRMAQHLASFEKDVDMDVLVAACLLHDIGRPAQLKDPALSHALVGEKLAPPILLELGFSEEFAHRVADCIRTHSYRQNDPPQSLEAKLLFDADKLDVCGALGVARTLLYQGRLGLPLYETDAQGNPLRTACQGGESYFSEADGKLTSVHGRMFTKEGARIAQERKKTLDLFTQALWEEIQP